MKIKKILSERNIDELKELLEKAQKVKNDVLVRYIKSELYLKHWLDEYNFRK